MTDGAGMGESDHMDHVFGEHWFCGTKYDNMQRFYLPYPVSKNRTTRQQTMPGSNKPVYPAGRRWKARAQASIKEQGCNKITSANIGMACVLHPRKNKDGSASQNRLDLQNAWELVLDTMQGLVYENDKQITSRLELVGHPVEDGGLTIFVGREFSEYQYLHAVLGWMSR